MPSKALEEITLRAGKLSKGSGLPITLLSLWIMIPDWLFVIRLYSTLLPSVLTLVMIPVSKKMIDKPRMV